MPDKARERYHMDQFRAAIGLSGIVQEGEHPDFVVLSGGERIGIELTSFHLPPDLGERPEQEQVALQALAVERARSTFRDAGGVALYVNVEFSNNALNKQRAYVVGDELCRGLQALRLPERISDGPYEVPHEHLPNDVVACCVRASFDGQDELWQGGRGGWVAPVSAAHVQAELSRKAPKAQRMRRRCDQLWLVIVHDLFRSASCVLSPAALLHTYEHHFDRAYWLIAHVPTALELRK